MPLPNRPVDGAEIATEWGQAIHDRVFAPSGCDVAGGASTSCGTSPAALQLDSVNDDPGGYLDAANDRIEIPVDREGLYLAFVRGRSVNGSAGSGFETRISMLVNGSEVANGNEDNAGGVNVIIPITWVGALSAGDHITFTGVRRGGGTNPDVQILSIVLLRVGAELGA